MKASTALRVDRPADGVVRLTLDGPETRNSLSVESFAELADAVTGADRAPGTRVIILTGAGKGFCSGFDLSLAADLPALPIESMFEIQQRAAAMILAVCRTNTPVIAAVGGAAAGAGFSLAMAADVCLATPEATFNAAFVRVGFTGGDCGSSWLLPRAVGRGRASEILLTGRMVSANEAERIGLVSRVVPRTDLETATLELANQIRGNSPFGVSLTKRVLHTNVDAPSLEAAMEVENRNQMLATRSADFTEALTAFQEGREPRFGDERR